VEDRLKTSTVSVVRLEAWPNTENPFKTLSLERVMVSLKRCPIRVKLLGLY
jgi:hypothetical protein